MNNKENIIAFDFQGWPVRKLTLKEILVKLGAHLNTKTNMYEIDKSFVETIPTVYTDDGMGYGVNEAYIVDADRNETDECRVWIDAADKNIDIYLKDEVYPGMSIVTPESRMYMVETYIPETCTYRVREFPEGAMNFLPAEFIDRDIVLEWTRKNKIKDEYSNYTIQDFKDEKGFVRILQGKYAGKVGRVLAIPVSEGGNGYFMLPGQVSVFIENGAETFYPSALDKITEEEYYKELEKTTK